MTHAASQHPKTNHPRAAGIRVVICDDELHIRQALNSLLSTYSFSKPGDLIPPINVVGNASNGQEAIWLVAKLHPDVVLMDARMPVMDGFDATQRIKMNWPQVKVIILTMYSEHQSAALAAGADVFLLKGCPGENLLDAITGIIL